MSEAFGEELMHTAALLVGVADLALAGAGYMREKFGDKEEDAAEEAQFESRLKAVETRLVELRNSLSTVRSSAETIALSHSILDTKVSSLDRLVTGRLDGIKMGLLNTRGQLEQILLKHA